MTTFLLIVVILILLFGAGAVKGWIQGVLLWIVGGSLFVLASIGLISLLGEEGFYWLLGIGAFILMLASMWARSYDEGEAAHKRRIKLAQEQRRKRREEGKKW